AFCGAGADGGGRYAGCGSCGGDELSGLAVGVWRRPWRGGINVLSAGSADDDRGDCSAGIFWGSESEHSAGAVDSSVGGAGGGGGGDAEGGDFGADGAGSGEEQVDAADADGELVAGVHGWSGWVGGGVCGDKDDSVAGVSGFAAVADCGESVAVRAGFLFFAVA